MRDNQTRRRRRRRGAAISLTVVWHYPILCFACERAWLSPIKSDTNYFLLKTKMRSFRLFATSRCGRVRHLLIYELWMHIRI